MACPYVHSLCLSFNQPVQDNFNQPSQAMYVFLRWGRDLERVVGSGGRDYWNVGGWFNPNGGSTLPIVSHVAVRVGSNSYMLKPTRVEHLMDYEHTRHW